MGAIQQVALSFGASGPAAFTLNPADKDSTIVLTNGNLTASKTGGNGHVLVRATAGVSSGKWYWEVRQDSGVSNDSQIGALTKTTAATNASPGNATDGYSYDGINGFAYHAGSGSAYGATYASTDIIGVAFDATSGKLWFAKNNTWQASGNPAAGTGAAFTGIAAGTWFPTVGMFDSLGQATARFKASDQTYAPPSGFTAIG